tara:strand:- start:3640 stop:4845 length:1206 start_codon:yes stop_codon:yes gene_type:complete
MLIFHNPDRLWYHMTLSQWFRSSRAMDKYSYIFDEEIRKGKVNVLISSNKNKRYISSIFFKFSRFIRFFLWAKINKLSIKSFNIFFDASSFEKDDVIFSFFHDNFARLPVCCDEEAYISDLKNTEASILIHLNHYVYSTIKGSERLKFLKNVFFTAESNLKDHSSFFKKFFKWYTKNFYVLPFCSQKRFVEKKELREKKAIATGAITYEINEPHFTDFFKTNILQPERLNILDKKDALKNVEVIINKYPKSYRDANFFSFVLDKYIKSFKKYFITFFKTKTTEYYSLDIVSLYNSFEFFLCPGELGDLPGIGISEGMSSGAILISKRYDYFDDYELIPNNNYLEYDGSIENLEKVIDNFKDDQEKINALRERSLKTAKKFFSQNSCLKVFSEILIDIKSER